MIGGPDAAGGSMCSNPGMIQFMVVAGLLGVLVILTAQTLRKQSKRHKLLEESRSQGSHDADAAPLSQV